ncbi:hypothetical protein niasHT_018753 [Heterodera trifolii]|uniref:BTB domain-containing protein n=1 Tax=Heterodera trifolii TaxID=157864 RepID=A0ABD2LBE7_9BILA
MKYASDVFGAMFRFDSQNENASANDPVVEIPDVEPSAFKVLLNFIYGDEFSGLNGENAMAVLYAAENRRQMLGPALFKIRLPLFSQEDFSEKIEEVVGIEQYHSQSKMCGSSDGLLYPLLFPSHQRNLSFGKIVMVIEKVSQFAGKKLGSLRYSEIVLIRGLPWNIVAKINAKNGSTDQKWLEFYLKCAAEINGSERKGETVHIKGLPWKIMARINRSADDEKCLGFYLLCGGPKETSNWSRKCSATLRIGSDNFSDMFDGRVFSNESSFHGFDVGLWFSHLELVGTNKGWYDKKEDKVTVAIDIYLDGEKMEKPYDSIFS